MAPRLALVWYCLCLLVVPVAAQDGIDYPELLRQMTDLRSLCDPAVDGEACVQFSSYDRRSDAGPGEPEAWYANADRGQFLGTEERNGRVEHVMVDTEGPGCVARIWSANPSGKLFFYLDGAVEPTWEVDFRALTSGRMAPLLEPLAGVRSRGANCHLPIPFAKHLKITASSDDFYYQVNVWRMAPGRKVRSFRPEFLEQYVREIEACRGDLAQSAGVPGSVELIDRRGESTAPGVLVAVSLPAGSVVRGLDARVKPGAEDEADPADRYRQVLVVVRCGDEQLVRVPFADFFGAAPDLHPYEGHVLGVRKDGTGYCRFPMPMPREGEVALVVEGEAFPIGYLLQLVVDQGTAGQDDLLFRADWHQAKGIPTRPFSDHQILDAKGLGRFAGCALMVRNPVKGWWGEGDEKLWVDGEEFPSTFGTGTEDYFGYAWCCPDPFTSALHAQPQCDGPGNYGFTSVNRVHLLDAVPFQRSFRFDLEVWHWTPGITVDYATVAYWYGARGARSGLPPLPPPEERTVDRLPAYRVHRVAGAVEGEALRVIEATGGRYQTQAMDAFGADDWSGEAQLWWIDGKPGDRLLVAVPVEAAGSYRLLAAFTRANDYGIVKLAIAGKGLGKPVDLYNPSVVPSGEVDFGVVDLTAGEATLVFEIAGRNAKAIPRHMVGVDYLRLEKVK